MPHQANPAFRLQKSMHLDEVNHSSFIDVNYTHQHFAEAKDMNWNPRFQGLKQSPIVQTQAEVVGKALKKGCIEIHRLA